MSNIWVPERTSRPASRPSGQLTWTTFALLAAVLLLGAYFRTLNLFGWDGDSNLHPDERFIVYTVNNLAVPRSFGDYLQSACPTYNNQLNNALDRNQPLDRQEPSRDSGCNTLNPRSYNWSRMFVYGTLPTSLTRLVVEARAPDAPRGVDGRPQIPPEIIRNTGRTLSTLFDLGSIVLVFMLGWRLYGQRVGLLAALFYALSVLPIQLSHFFTVDATTAFFTLLAIYWAVRIAQGGRWGSFVALGLSIGAAMACRITLGTLALAGVLAVLARVLGDKETRRQGDKETRITAYHRPSSIVYRLIVPFAWLVLAGIIAFFTFRLLQPDAFVGSAPGTPLPEGTAPTLLNRVFQGRGFFDLRPEPRFLANIQQVSGFVSGEVDFPPGHQWANRTPFWFSWKNIVLWGMGLPLGVAAWLGWAVAGWHLIRRRALMHLIPWAWITFYFLWQGGQFVMTMRYYGLLYGLLALFGAWLLISMYDLRFTIYERANRIWLLNYRLSSIVYRLPLIVVIIGTLLWAYAFTRIYTDPHSRILASRWIYDNVPPGATITSEQWDDALPLSVDGRSDGQYDKIQMSPYAEDEPTKYAGSFDSEGKPNGLLDQLDKADYIILSSNRVYDSISRMPARFPATIRYYHYLFSGELGFELAADVHSYPRLFGIEIPTPVYAEEAFSVYDHPRVLIFKKTPAYSRAQAEQLITGGMAWDEIYKLPAVKTGRAPTALRLTDVQWPSFRASGTWETLFSAGSLWSWAPWLPWLVVLELLGFAMWALLFGVLRGLPDRGFALAKTLGLLLVAYVGWLLASLGAADGTPLLSYTPASARVYALLLVLAGAAVGWRNRAAMLAFARERRSALLSAEGLFLLAFFGFLVVRALNPDLWHPARGGEKPMDLAFLTATLKSPAFPPYDPWFAGGYINYYYFGFVFVGTLIHLTGIVPTVAYNLAVPTVFALTALGAWGVGYNLVAWRTKGEHKVRPYIVTRSPAHPLTRSRTERRAIATGILAAVFVVLLGNLAQVVWFLPGTADRSDPGMPAQCIAISSYAAQQACRGRAEWAFWDATRVVGAALHDSTINEFPFFTFLYGDLHAHMLALPLALAVLGLLVAFARTMDDGQRTMDDGRRLAASGVTSIVYRLSSIVLLALTIGALRATNTWDYPAYLGISAVALGLVAWRGRGAAESPARMLGRWGLGALALVVLSNLLFLPFTRSFATDYAGIQIYNGSSLPLAELIRQNGFGRGLLAFLVEVPRTPLTEFVRVNGLWMFLLLSAAWVRFQMPRGGSRVVQIAVPLLGLLLLLAALLGTFSFSALLPLVLLVGCAVGLLFYMAFQDHRRDDETATRASMPTLLVVLFAVSALVLTLVPELVTSKGDTGRMNTVFKLGMQSWTLFAVASAVALTWLWQAVGNWQAAISKESSIVRIAWRGAVALVIGGALVYPLTATPARLADRFDTQIGPTLDGTAFLQNASWEENGKRFSLADDAAALAWIQANIRGTPIILEAQTEAYRWGARVSVYTGLPTLLGWPGHQRQQRSAVQVDPVLQSRQVLIQQLYDNPQADTVLDLLRKYGVEYVYVGDLERALYNPAGLAKFDALADAGQIVRVYDRDNTRIYHIPPSDAPPAILTTTLPVRPPTLSQKSLMLDRPVGELPVVQEYAWNPLGQSSAGALLLWLLASYMLLLLGLPLAVLVFGRWRDGGYTWARLIGLLLLGYAVWLPVSARLWYYNWIGLLLGFVLVVALDVVVLGLLGRWTMDDGRWSSAAEDSSFVIHHSSITQGLRVIAKILNERRRAVLRVEALWLLAFAFMAAVRALNPDLWQPIWGGEKPFEFGLLNAILRSPVMPPYSPFFSDGVVNYYYYGLFLVSLPIKATGIAPAIGFNLAVATLFALMVIGAFTLVAQLTRRARYGLIGVAFVTVVGNFTAVFKGGTSDGISPVLDALRGGLDGFGAQLDAWFIGPSRVIPNTINEFPYWSFLFADLHPHLIALPITLLAVALAYQLFADGRWTMDGRRWQHADEGFAIVYRLSSIVVAALTLGALAITNSWDFPTYALLLGGALVGAAWRRPSADSGARLWALGGAVATALGVAGGALLLYLPFFQNFAAQVQGIAPVANGSNIGAYLLIYGLFLLVLVPATFGAVWRLTQRRGAPDAGYADQRASSAAALHFAAPSLSRASSAWLPRRKQLRSMLLIVAVLLLVITVAQPVLALKLWLGLLLLLGATVLLSRRVAPATWFGYWMAVVAWAVSLGFELVFVRDHLAGGDWQRMNTVFKFGLQAWVLMALAAATLLPLLLRGLRRLHPLAENAGMLVLAVFSALALVFPLAGTPSRVSYRFPISPASTLDGLAFMEQASYEWEGHQIDLRADGEAIRWLNEHIVGTPVVLQSSNEFYRSYGVRVAANTGLPTVVSPLHENEQRDPALVGERDTDVQQLYNTTDANEALRLLAKYRVQYLYVGAIERAVYGEQGTAKFASMVGTNLSIAYRNDGVTIYAVEPSVLSMSGLPPLHGAPAAAAPAAPTGQAPLQVLEEQNKANPKAAGPAFALALRLREQGRFEDAAAVLGAAATFNPGDVALHHLWGDLLRDLGRTDEAIMAYRLAAQAEPTPANYNKLGVELFKLGKLDDARLAFDQALARGATETDPYFYLGQIYERQNDREKAVTNYKQYLSAAPDGEHRDAATAALERLK